jgi:hypothetical protein
MAECFGDLARWDGLRRKRWRSCQQPGGQQSDEGPLARVDVMGEDRGVWIGGLSQNTGK